MYFFQIRDINSGTFGFVELALDKTTGQQVAIKFIDRGEKVCTYLLHHHGSQYFSVWISNIELNDTQLSLCPYM